MGKPFLPTAGDLCNVEILIANKADIVCQRRDLGIGFKGLGGGQLPWFPALQIVEMQITSQGKQQPFPILRPLIGNNTLEPGNTLALAACLFLVRKDFFVRLQLFGINQHAGLARGHIVFPQIKLAGIRILFFEKGDPFAVR